MGGRFIPNSMSKINTRENLKMSYLFKKISEVSRGSLLMTSKHLLAFVYNLFEIKNIHWL